MLFYLFVLFTVIPLVELMLLVWIGTHTHWWVPILLVVSTALVGAALARWQGWRALQRIQDEMRAGRVPTDALIDGVMILVAGILLVTPGVLTDMTGIVLLVPPLRRLVKRGVKAWFVHHVRVQTAGFADFSGDGQRNTTQGDRIVDAQVIDTRVEDAT
jgi:UPF0716 protein FxsA